MNNTQHNQFNVGQTYTTRSICDYDCVYSWKVVRTSKTSVWFTGSCVKGVQRRSVKTNLDGRQFLSPLGTYSMSPTIHA